VPPLKVGTDAPLMKISDVMHPDATQINTDAMDTARAAPHYPRAQAWLSHRILNATHTSDELGAWKIKYDHTGLKSPVFMRLVEDEHGPEDKKMESGCVYFFYFDEDAKIQYVSDAPVKLAKLLTGQKSISIKKHWFSLGNEKLTLHDLIDYQTPAPVIPPLLLCFFFLMHKNREVKLRSQRVHKRSPMKSVSPFWPARSLSTNN
jgi:hypothetical protein